MQFYRRFAIIGCNLSEIFLVSTLRLIILLNLLILFFIWNMFPLQKYYNTFQMSSLAFYHYFHRWVSNCPLFYVGYTEELRSKVMLYEKWFV